MKKVVSFVLACAMVLGLVSVLNVPQAQAITLDDANVSTFADDTYVQTVNAGKVEFTPGADFGTFKAVGGDPWMLLNIKTPTAIGEYPYWAIRYKAPSGATSEQAWIYPKSDKGDITQVAVVDFNVVKSHFDGEWHTAIVNLKESFRPDILGKTPADTDKLVAMRISAPENSELQVAWMGTFKTEEDVHTYETLFDNKGQQTDPGTTNPTPAYVADFTTQAGTNTANPGDENNCTFVWDEATKSLKVTSSGADPYFKIRNVADKFDCGTHKYMAIRLKNPSAELVKHVFMYESAVAPWLEKLSVPLDSGMTEFKTFVADMTTLSNGGWSGAIKQLRLDFVRDAQNAAPNGSVYYLAWVAFFDSEADAKAYKGPAGTDTSYDEEHATAPTEPTEEDIDYGTLTFVKAAESDLNADPHFNIVTDAFNPAQAKYIAVKYRLKAGTAAKWMQIYAKSPAEPAAKPELIADGQWHVVFVDTSTIANWTSTDSVDGFRFDPLEGDGTPNIGVKTGDSIDIAWIALTETQPGSDYDGTGALILISAEEIVNAAKAEGALGVDAAKTELHVAKNGPTGEASVMGFVGIAMVALGAICVLRKKRAEI